MASQVVDVERVGNRIEVTRKNGNIEKLAFDHRTYVQLLKDCFGYHQKHYQHHKRLGGKAERNLKQLLQRTTTN